MKKHKKLWISLLSFLLVAALEAGIFVYMENRSAEPVHVYDINNMAYDDWGSDSTTGGQITTDKFQAVHLTSTQMVTGIHVRVGQQVKKGTKLLTYDTTISQLALDRKKLAIQRDELRLKDAKNELSEIRGMKPIVYVEKPDKPSSNSSGPKGDLGASGYQIYSGKGTGGSPARVWVDQNIQFTNDLMHSLIQDTTGGSDAYVIVEYRQGNSANGEVTNRIGMHITQIEVPVARVATYQEERPVERTENQAEESSEEITETIQESVQPYTKPDDSTPPDTSETESPTIETGETTEPSETTAPSETTEPSETTKPSETTEPPETTPIEPAPAPEIQYTIKFFAPSENSKEPEDEIIWNSGFTAAEIAQKKTEKEAEIKDLTFSIKMANAELNIMQKEFDNGEITSEISGHVVSVISAEEAAETGEPIIKISGGGGFLIQGSVNELNRDAISIGQTVTVTSYNDFSTYEGTIVEIGDYPVSGDQYDANPNSSYYPFTVSISEDANLQDGYYAEIAYNTTQNQEGSFYLESAFILTENGKSYVYVRNAEGLLEKREIQTGATVDNGSSTKVLSGLTLTDYIAFPYGSDLEAGAPTEEADVSELYAIN